MDSLDSNTTGRSHPGETHTGTVGVAEANDAEGNMAVTATIRHGENEAGVRLPEASDASGPGTSEEW